MQKRFIPLAGRKSDSKDSRRAKALRKEAPLCERLLWNALRESTAHEAFRFRRQHPIHPYIVDFACLRAKLVVEIDGRSHDGQQRYDERRDACLNKLGYKVMRFANEDVRENLEGIVLTFIAAVKNRLPNSGVVF
jgi:very-short-patch-repair endonuclease